MIVFLSIIIEWNRRIAKQRSKTSWYKGKAEVEPPTSIQEEEKNCEFSIHKEGKHQETAHYQRDRTEGGGFGNTPGPGGWKNVSEGWKLRQERR